MSKIKAADYEAAIDALETEIVVERAKAIAAQNEALKWSEKYQRLRESHRDKVSRLADEKETLEERVSEQTETITSMQEEIEAMNAAEALQDYLVSIGYPSRPLKVEKPELQRLVDIVL